MNYSQALRYLNTFTDLEKLAQFPKNSFFNLKRMEHLLRIGGHPEKKFFPVLIAGTTGKGSTGFFLESILEANGISTGYYHSPHVEDPRERIRVRGAMTSPKVWAEGLSWIQKLLRKNSVPERLGILTYFEILTFLAIWVFAQRGVAVGIFEIGLGGRLDATNVLKASLVILTPIHLDHEAFLGNTIAKIAAEKAGIIKPQTHVVTGKQFPEAFEVIRRAVRANRGSLWTAKPVSGLPLGLAGNFQKMNAGTALKAAEILAKRFHFPIDPERSGKGLQCRNWQGRMESFYRGGSRLILDGAHNPLSVKELISSLKAMKIRDPWLVFGAMRDKNSQGMLKILSGFFSKVILTEIAGNRAKSAAMLVEEAKGLFNCILTAHDIEEALGLLKRSAAAKETAVITGSFYLVGEARKILK
ncbi:MAG: folylpolyglutamate synthase/dihydrofolate synthase family protein [Candidatus Omnitrophota bacterium]